MIKKDLHKRNNYCFETHALLFPCMNALHECTGTIFLKRFYCLSEMHYQEKSDFFGVFPDESLFLDSASLRETGSSSPSWSSEFDGVVVMEESSGNILYLLTQEAIWLYELLQDMKIIPLSSDLFYSYYTD